LGWTTIVHWFLLRFINDFSHQPFESGVGSFVVLAAQHTKTTGSERTWSKSSLPQQHGMETGRTLNENKTRDYKGAIIKQ
jgi:hypothetical protein